MANPDPGGVTQRERRRGFWPDVEGMADVPPARCFRSLVINDNEECAIADLIVVDHPRWTHTPPCQHPDQRGV